MVGGFICGISSFPREKEQEHESLRSPKHSFKRKLSRSKEDSNPYAARGLKQFCALLAEIEEKRQKIYSEVGAEAISLIQFVYSNDNKCKPVVVIRPRPRPNGNVEVDGVQRSLVRSSHVAVSDSKEEHLLDHDRVGDCLEKRSCMGILIKSDRFSVQPCHRLPIMVIMALLFLALFGRSAAIVCASIGWYLVPSVTQNGKSDLRRPMKNKKEKMMLGQMFSSFNTSKEEHLSPIGRRSSLLKSHSSL